MSVEPRRDELVRALERADKLINWMAHYIRHMAPLSYHNCYHDLNEHFLFMERYRRRELDEHG